MNEMGNVEHHDEDGCHGEFVPGICNHGKDGQEDMGDV